MPITINGVAYEPRDRDQKKERASLSEIMLFVFMSSTLPYPQKRGKPLPVSDIVAEFELIQRKESKLPRSQRDRVVWAFNKMYKQVKNK